MQAFCDTAFATAPARRPAAAGRRLRLPLDFHRVQGGGGVRV